MATVTLESLFSDAMSVGLRLRQATSTSPFWTASLRADGSE